MKRTIKSQKEVFKDFAKGIKEVQIKLSESFQKAFGVNKLYIGIDNGVSGTIGWSGICNGKHVFGQIPTPVFSQLNYTKEKKNINRVDFQRMLIELGKLSALNPSLFLCIERPMVNPGRFAASVSAIRALECTQIVIEHLQIPFKFIDSKEWQKIMLPKGLKGPELKSASVQIGRNLFPSIECKPDADGILIAEYARRNNF